MRFGIVVEEFYGIEERNVPDDGVRANADASGL